MPERLFLEDKVAIMTGAGRGIGRAIALEFAKEGGHVVVAEIMIKQGSGVIENVVSVHWRLVRMQEHYSSAKAALVMLTEELATQYGPYGIRVNAIAPGAINTAENSEDADPAMATDFKNSIILGRRGKPEEVARMAVVLASDYWSSYVTGATFYVSGGLELSNWVTRQYLP